MAEEIDDYTKCLLVATKTSPIYLGERELDDLFNTRAFTNLRRQACQHVGGIITKMSDPKTTPDEWRMLQGEFRALHWLVKSRARLKQEFEQQQNLKAKKPGDHAENERRLTTLLDGREIEDGKE